MLKCVSMQSSTNASKIAFFTPEDLIFSQESLVLLSAEMMLRPNFKNPRPPSAYSLIWTLLYFLAVQILSINVDALAKTICLSSYFSKFFYEHVCSLWVSTLYRSKSSLPWSTTDEAR